MAKKSKYEAALDSLVDKLQNVGGPPGRLKDPSTKKPKKPKWRVGVDGLARAQTVEPEEPKKDALSTQLDLEAQRLFDGVADGFRELWKNVDADKPPEELANKLLTQIRTAYDVCGFFLLDVVVQQESSKDQGSKKKKGKKS